MEEMEFEYFGHSYKLCFSCEPGRWLVNSYIEATSLEGGAIIKEDSNYHIVFQYGRQIWIQRRKI